MGRIKLKWHMVICLYSSIVFNWDFFNLLSPFSCNDSTLPQMEQQETRDHQQH